MNAPALELKGITKRFGPVVANRSIDLTVYPGEIHAVVGENGAGKSTLLQIAAGIQTADAGEILVQGEILTRPSAARAIARGIGMVQQHFLLIPPFTVAENIVLGAEPHRGPLLDRARAEAAVRKLAERFGLHVDPTRRVEDLSVGEQQRVEILKVLYRNAKLLILDEPTAVLAPVEVDDLFRVLRSLVDQGRTVIFVTHKLREVMAVSDRVTVLRRGRVVATSLTRDTSIDTLADLMVGKSTTPASPPAAQPREPIPAHRDRTALEVENLQVVGRHGRPAVDRITFQVAPGEIVGIAGVQGNGQTELVEAIAGLLPYSGHVRLAGRNLDSLSPGERLQAGLAHIPEDRQHRGLVLEFSVADNFILGAQATFSRPGRLLIKRIDANARQHIRAFDVRPPNPAAAAQALSGGNQQKVVVARELGRNPVAILAAQPTRGVDIGAMKTIHQGLRNAREAGAGILLISADLAELLDLSDRILVLFRGRIAAEFARDEATESRIGAAMVGARAPDPPPQHQTT